MLRQLFERRSISTDLGHPSTIERLLLGLGFDASRSGMEVTPQSSLGWTAFFAAVRILAETLATIPLHVYRRSKNGKDLADSHPLYGVLHDAPNPEMTSFEWRDVSMVHAVTFGNAYSQIVLRGDGHVAELWPLNPDRVRPERQRNGQLWYRISLPSEPGGAAIGSTLLPADEILHIRGFSLNGILGLTPAFLHRDAIGLGLATEAFAAQFFGRGANATGFLQSKTALSDKAKDTLRREFEKVYGGLDNAHRLMVLEEGLDFKQLTIEPEKAQFLGSRNFQVNEASRMTRVPPHMLAQLERSSLNNIEHQGIEFAIYAMLPWAVRWEQRMEQSLLLRPEQRNFFIGFLLDGLLRGDQKSRYDAYAIGRQWGWLSANDVREKENMNPIVGGDTYMTPLNMVPSTTPTPITPGDAPPIDDQNRALRAAVQLLLQRAA